MRRKGFCIGVHRSHCAVADKGDIRKPMFAPVFRLARPADAAQMAELRVAMQREVKDLAEAAIHADSVAQIRAFFDESLATQNYIGAVADMDGSLVAANGLVFYRRPPGLKGNSGLIGYVTNVYTVPQWRGRGIASALMKILIGEARRLKLDKIHLGATDDGVGVYRKCGFLPVNHTAMEMNLHDDSRT